MGLQATERHQEETSVQTQGTSQCAQKQTIMRLKFLRETLTCDYLVYNLNGTGAVATERLEHQTSGICPRFSTGRH